MRRHSARFESFGAGSWPALVVDVAMGGTVGAMGGGNSAAPTPTPTRATPVEKSGAQSDGSQPPAQPEGESHRPVILRFSSGRGLAVGGNPEENWRENAKLQAEESDRQAALAFQRWWDDEAEWQEADDEEEEKVQAEREAERARLADEEAARAARQAARPGDGSRVFVVTLDGTRTPVETARDETVACLMLRVHHVTGVPSYQQRLVFDYVELKASDTRLCDCGIEADAALHLLVDTTAPFSVNMGQHDTAPQKRARGSGDSY